MRKGGQPTALSAPGMTMERSLMSGHGRNACASLRVNSADAYYEGMAAQGGGQASADERGGEAARSGSRIRSGTRSSSSVRLSVTLDAWFEELEATPVFRECLGLDGWTWEGFSD